MKLFLWQWRAELVKMLAPLAHVCEELLYFICYNHGKVPEKESLVPPESPTHSSCSVHRDRQTKNPLHYEQVVTLDLSGFKNLKSINHLKIQAVPASSSAGSAAT